MFYCYILLSVKNGSYYVGSTNNFSKRLEHHNFGIVRSTKHFGPWELVYIESFNCRAEAVSRERQIKSWKKRAMIEKLISKK